MNRWKKFRPLWVLLASSLVLLVAGGCSNSPTDGENTGQETSIETFEIICHGLAPEPGVIDTLTVLATGYSPDYAVYTWSSDGGSFPEGNTGISVKWLAPETPGLYKITVIGTIENKADTSSRIFAVRYFEPIDTGRKFSVAPRYTFNSLYFFGDADNYTPRSIYWKGFFGYKYQAPGSNQLVTPTGEPFGGGYNLFLPEGGSCIAGSFYRTWYIGLQQQRLDSWLFPIGIGEPNDVSNDGGGTVLRKNQHLHPYINQSCQKMVWEAHIAGNSADGTEDLVNVMLWDNFSGDKSQLTVSHDSSLTVQGPDTVWVHRYYNNVHPFLTPDDAHVIYFVDTTGVFEPCIIDLDGDTPDIGSRRAMMVDDETGIFGQQDVRINQETYLEWSPTLNVMAFIDTRGQLCFFDYTTESVIVSAVEKAESFAWSPDGAEVAVVSESGIWRVSAAGMASSTPVFTRERDTDGLYGIAWNSDETNPEIAWRMVRKGKDANSSFSALMLYYVNDDISVYASKAVNWSSAYEPAIPFYYMRLEFGPDGVLYAPIPTPLDATAECRIYKSYE